MLAAGPTIGVVDAPLDPVAPGSRLNISFDDVSTAPGAHVTALTLFRDSNANGVHDPADEVFGAATQDPFDTDRWVYSEVVRGDIAPGDVTLFAVQPTPATMRATYPNRGDLPLPDLLSRGVAERHHHQRIRPDGESERHGCPVSSHRPLRNRERDAIIAEGTIPAHSRGGITISEYANPGEAAVRLTRGMRSRFCHPGTSGPR